jgi:uncharacterized protein involved in exopolysaccharide biosynthesis
MMRLTRSSVSLRQFVHTLFRHKRKMGIVILLITGLAAAGTLLMPRAYRSQAKLIIRLGRENATLDPTATLNQTPVTAVPSNREDDMNSAREILASRFLAEKVVDAVGPAAILGRGQPLPAPAPGAPAAPAGDTPERSQAVGKFMRKLEVEVVKKSNIIGITYDGPSPEVAEAVVTRLIDCYVERHAYLHRTRGAHKFFADQAARMRAQLAQTEEALRDAKKETGLFSPEAQRLALVNRVAQLQDDLLKTEALLAAGEAQAKALRSRLTAMEPTQVTAVTKGLPNEVGSSMRTQLFSLQLREKELLGRLLENHPEVLRVRQQIANAREALAREEKDRETVTTGPSKTYEDAQAALLRQETEIVSLRARADEVRRQRDREREALQALNRNEVTVARLQRDVELQTTAYRKYAENLEQAEIDQSLEADRISNINVVQPATYDDDPVRPRPVLYLVLALVVALLAAFGVAVLAENLDRSLKTAEEVEAVLGLPVLASVPRLVPRPLTPNGRR